MLAPAPGEGDERREAVLRAQRVERLTALERGRRHARTRAHLRPHGGPLVHQQDVGEVVDQRRDRQRVDGLQGDRLDGHHDPTWLHLSAGGIWCYAAPSKSSSRAARPVVVGLIAYARQPRTVACA